MKQPFRYDVAFSFLEKDEEAAMEINRIIEGRIATFLYSKKQENIAGKDGEKEFNKVFEQEARVVVVLFSLEWGKTPWTRIEETAIRNRGYAEGYDFVVFIMTKTELLPPKWLPKNRLWVGLERYGFEGAAAVIEARVQELGGEVHEPTAADKAKHKAKEIEFEYSRQQFLRSKESVDLAYKEVAKLFSELKKIVNQIQSKNLKFKIDEDDHNLIVYSSGYTLSIFWSLQYANSLEHSALRLQIFKGSIPYKNRMPIENPERLVEESYYFDITMSGQCRWRYDGYDRKLLTTDQIVERGVTNLMDQIKANKIKNQIE